MITCLMTLCQPEKITMIFWSHVKMRLLTFSAVFLLAGSAARADNELLPPSQVTPCQTSVLLLPPLDVTPDSAHMLAPRRLVIRHREEYEFITRQFKMLGEAMAAKAAEAGPKIDLAALSARTAGNLDVLAKRTGADWAVNIIVQDAKGNSSAGQEAFKVRTRVLLQVWDARRHRWLANGPYTGEDSGGGSPVFVFENSLDDATKSSLGNILGVYPQVVSVVGESGLKDYLAGQKEPFVGSPKTPFSGLKANH
jgi:hypothetical protein